jgi:hypothetical protein
VAVVGHARSPQAQVAVHHVQHTNGGGRRSRSRKAQVGPPRRVPNAVEVTAEKDRGDDLIADQGLVHPGETGVATDPGQDLQDAALRQQVDRTVTNPWAFKTDSPTTRTRLGQLTSPTKHPHSRRPFKHCLRTSASLAFHLHPRLIIPASGHHHPLHRSGEICRMLGSRVWFPQAVGGPVPRPLHHRHHNNIKPNKPVMASTTQGVGGVASGVVGTGIVEAAAGEGFELHGQMWVHRRATGKRPRAREVRPG